MLKAIVNLIKKTSTELPKDIENLIELALREEDKNSTAEIILTEILKNVRIARDNSLPICQDTGFLIFNVYYPSNPSNKLRITELEVKDYIIKAVEISTEKGYLRPNAIDSITGINSSNNIGLEFPELNFIQWNEKKVRIELLLKGGGCENVSMQYSLPDKSINAERNIEGVFRCALDTVLKAQGKACAPGFLGIGIGGNKVTSAKLARNQFFKSFEEKNKNNILYDLENKILNSSNKLGIGPMGLGGKKTILGVKVDVIHRIPATYFVSVSYMCWAFRRGEVEIFEI